MNISIMITTRNRRDDLYRTLSRLRKLMPGPEEIIVCADGCTDDTIEMVRTDFPEATLIQNQVGRGSIASRDRMLRMARGEWVLSLDDDSYPVDDGFLARVEAVCSDHPEAAVITFPELRDEGYASAIKTPDSPGQYVAAYANCGALMQRAFYLKQPGFPGQFFHMYEEPDYALQCYAAGMSVWFEPSLVIRHHMSPVQRFPVRRHHQNARNELWSVWIRCPWPQLPVVAAFRVWRQFRYTLTEGLMWAMQEPLWWWQAIKGMKACAAVRRPITWAAYYAWMKLAREPIFDRATLKLKFIETATQ